MHPVYVWCNRTYKVHTSNENYEAHLEFYFPFSYRQQDTSSRAKHEASDRWSESDNRDAYKVDNETHAGHSWNNGHTRNMKYDHKLHKRKPYKLIEW